MQASASAAISKFTARPWKSLKSKQFECVKMTSKLTVVLFAYAEFQKLRGSAEEDQINKQMPVELTKFYNTTLKIWRNVQKYCTKAH